MAIEKAPKHGGGETLAAIGDQAFLDFQQRHVRPAANETEQIVAMGLDTTGTTISPRRSRRDLALGFEARHPAHGAGDADPQNAWLPRCATCRLPPPPPQRVREDRRKAPSPPPPSHGDNLQADQNRFGNPSHDSIRSETALTTSRKPKVTRLAHPKWRLSCGDAGAKPATPQASSCVYLCYASCDIVVERCHHDFSIDATLFAANGLPRSLRWPRASSSAAMSRSDRLRPLTG